MPTFRNSITANRVDATTNHQNIGMPLIYSNEQLSDLNDFLKLKNLFIVYKPHPVQDISTLNAKSMSNILVIDDQYLANKDLQLYEVISHSSALITDYSSVFFDYLLLNRPIGTTTDDIEEWKKNRGFAFDLESMYDQATERISDLDKLIEFIQGVVQGIDNKAEKRAEIRDLTNVYQDGDSTKRTVEFIFNNIQERWI